MSVLVESRAGVGHLTLNRPKAINALSHEMVTLIHAALIRWREDPEVRTILLDGAGERGFCAGGDIRAIYADAVAGGSESATYWADEYRLNAAIADFPKPVVVLMDGIVMGGGVGLAGHASHRIVSESSVVAMPEVTIGFAPDVGGTFLLAHAPGELGTYLGLTSARMSAGDAIACGFADHYIPVAAREKLLRALHETDADSAVAGVLHSRPASDLLANQSWIDDCYAAPAVEEILARLSTAGRDAGQLAAMSPTALKVTLAALRLARHDTSLSQSLVRELRVSVHSLGSHDLIEGIRAQVIDKDRTPQWKPASLAEVSTADVQRFFAPLGDGELDLDSEIGRPQ